MLPVKTNGRGARVALALAATIVAGIAACTSRISDAVAGPKPQVATRSATADTNQPYFEFQATKLARQIPGAENMHYPDLLRAANVEGEVLAQFVVDREGRVEPGTFKALKSNHELFTQAVQTALPDMRFYPAEVKGVRVKQLVQQPFTFGLSSNVLKSNHQLFSDAVMTALPTMRFTPAIVGGKAVSQLLQQPFTFSLSKNW